MTAPSVRAALLAAALAALAPAAAEAKAFGGIVPDLPTGAHIAPAAFARAAGVGRPGATAPFARTANIPYQGGDVLHWNRTHLIFWEPAGSGLTFDPSYISVIDTFMRRVALDSHRPTSVYGLTGQYGDAGGPAVYDSIYGGAVVATDPLPPGGCVEPRLGGPGWTQCVDDNQLESELESVVTADHLPQAGNDIYFLITPEGLGDCEYGGPTNCALGGDTDGSFCGYHSVTAGGLLYAVIPYNAVPGHCQSNNPRPNSSPADPTISTISHEHIETVTDPFGDAWIDASSSEVADVCITNVGPSLGGAGAGAYNEVIHGGHYYLQEVWSNANSACEPRAASDAISFTATTVHAGSPTRLTASGDAPVGRIVAWKWFLGGGETVWGRRAQHTYSRPGTYRVVLRTTDSVGNWAFYAAVIRVEAPARRAPR
jgi:hypothetical protein